MAHLDGPVDHDRVAAVRDGNARGRHLLPLGNDPNLEEVEAPRSEKVVLVGAYKAAPRRAPDDSIHESALLKDPAPIIVRRGTFDSMPVFEGILHGRRDIEHRDRA